jgi:NTE family protein
MGAGNRPAAKGRKGSVAGRGAAESTPRGIDRRVGQVVLVLQGGGALGAYQAGVYEALSDAGVEPDWVVGTSIGAVNGALIAGNEPAARRSRLKEFWSRISDRRGLEAGWMPELLGISTGGLRAFATGVPGLFEPRIGAAWNVWMPVGIERAAFYSANPLKTTLSDLVNFDDIDAKRLRLTIGAVNARTGEMRYFDCRHTKLGMEHVLASSALPPGFPAVPIEGEHYWDGSIYSNTPIEVVFDDSPRRDSLIFSVNMWHAHGEEANSIWQVLAREQDIQFASRSVSHIARQGQIHRLRHVVRELLKHVPAERREDPEVKRLADYGCHTIMHIVPLLAPRLQHEDFTKAIDFTPASIEARWRAGHEQAQRMLEKKPWQAALDPLQSTVVHDG